jgi:hypothetical protein
MTHMIRIEFLKLRTTPALWATAALTLVLIVVSVATTVLLAGRPGTSSLGSVANVSSALAIGAATSVEMLVLGIMISAGEDRHRTTLSAYLAEPRRERVLVAKLIAASILGAVGGALSFGATLALAIPLYDARGIHHLPVNIAALWLGTIVITACYGLLGVSLGALTRNSVTAMVTAFIWFAVIEASLLAPLFPTVAKWLPTRAGVALTTADQHGSALLPPLVAAAVLVGWASLVSVTANFTTLHREPR